MQSPSCRYLFIEGKLRIHWVKLINKRATKKRSKFSYKVTNSTGELKIDRHVDSYQKTIPTPNVLRERVFATGEAAENKEKGFKGELCKQRA